MLGRVQQDLILERPPQVFCCHLHFVHRPKAWKTNSSPSLAHAHLPHSGQILPGRAATPGRLLRLSPAWGAVGAVGSDGERGRQRRAAYRSGFGCGDRGASPSPSRLLRGRTEWASRTRVGSDALILQLRFSSNQRHSYGICTVYAVRNCHTMPHVCRGGWASPMRMRTKPAARPKAKPRRFRRRAPLTAA